MPVKGRKLSAADRDLRIDVDRRTNAVRRLSEMMYRLDEYERDRVCQDAEQDLESARHHIERALAKLSPKWAELLEGD